MNVRTQRLGVATCVSCDAPLVDGNLVELEVTLDEIRAAEAREVVMDLRQVPYIDSRGLTFLLDLHDALRADGGSLRLASPSALCRDILAATRVDQWIPVYDDMEKVGRSFL